MRPNAVLRRLAAFPVLVALVLTTIFTLSGGGSAHAAKEPRKGKIVHGLDVARNQKGDPYHYGADGPGSFDCSGLMQFAYGKAGIRVPRVSGTRPATSTAATRRRTCAPAT